MSDALGQYTEAMLLAGPGRKFIVSHDPKHGCYFAILNIPDEEPIGVPGDSPAEAMRHLEEVFQAAVLKVARQN